MSKNFVLCFSRTDFAVISTYIELSQAFFDLCDFLIMYCKLIKYGAIHDISLNHYVF